MKLWLISQSANQNYETYDSAVVVARSEGEACKIHPSGDGESLKDRWHASWVGASDLVHCEYLGTAKPGTKQGVVLSSFNAG